jgi:hypothetical protein
MLSFFNREFLVWQTVMPLPYVFIHGFGYAAMLVAGEETDIVPLGNGHSISHLAFITTGAISEVLIQGALLGV